MKRRPDDFPENARRARRRKASLLRVGVSKLNNAKTGFVCRTIATQTDGVINVTYSCSATLIACDNSASSMSELAAGAIPGSARVPEALAFQEDPPGKRSWLAAQSCSQNRFPLRSRDRHIRTVFGPRSRPLTHATAVGWRTHDSAVLNNSTTCSGKQPHFRFTCFRQLNVKVSTPARLPRHKPWQSPPYGQRENRNSGTNSNRCSLEAAR